MEDYIVHFYKKTIPNFIEVVKPFLKKDLNNQEDPFSNKNLLKKLLLKHIEFLNYSPFDLNVPQSAPSTDRELNYGSISPKAELYLYSRNRILNEDILEFVKRTKYGWLFSITTDTYTFYLPDEYYFFNEEEKGFFIYLMNNVSASLQSIKSSVNNDTILRLSRISKEGSNLMKRYLFIYFLFSTFLRPLFEENVKYEPPIKNIEKHIKIERDENGTIKDVFVSPFLYYLFRKLIVMYDFYIYFFGPYGFFLKDRENIEEIIVNTSEGFIQLMSGGRVVTFYTPLSTEETLSYISQMLIHRNLSLSEENYIVNAELPTGDRTAFVHSIITGNVPNINIRIFKQIPLSVMDFYYFKNFGIDLIATLSILENISSTVFYSGGTGTGKTTALNAFIGLVPKNRFLIIVEDVREMDPFHPPEFTRREVAPREEVFDELVKAALRHSPDSIVFQEIRTPAVMEAFLDAVNTGHAGSMTTFHASTIEELLQRIKGFNLDPEAMKGLHYIYFIGRFEFKGRQLRRVTSLVEITDAVKGKTGVDIKNNKLFFLTTISEKSSENQMPMMYLLPELYKKNPILYTNFRNKYKIQPTKENFIELINVHGIFLKQLFEWIKRHPLWDGKKFYYPKENIIITLKEFLPEMVSLFYKYMEEDKDPKGNYLSPLMRLSRILNNLDKLGNSLLEKIKRELISNEMRFKKRMKFIIQNIFEIIEKEIIPPIHDKKKNKEFQELIRKLSLKFDIMEHRETIGSRIDMLTFMRMTEV